MAWLMDQVDEEQIFYQSDNCSYDQAYIRNGSQIVSNDLIINILSESLMEIAIQNSQNQYNQSQTCNSFKARNIPLISIKDYIKRIESYSHCSQESLIIGIIYLDRITQKNPQIVINLQNIHRLVLMSMVIGAKYFDDVYYDNKIYSKIGGICLQEFNKLELEFLYFINYKLYTKDINVPQLQQLLMKNINDNDVQKSNFV